MLIFTYFNHRHIIFISVNMGSDKNKKQSTIGNQVITNYVPDFVRLIRRKANLTLGVSIGKKPPF